MAGISYMPQLKCSNRVKMEKWKLIAVRSISNELSTCSVPYNNDSLANAP